MQNTKHLLWECPDVYTMWTKVGQLLDINITWYHVVTGDGLDKSVNSIITLIAYAVYKKFQIEKEFTVSP